MYVDVKDLRAFYNTPLGAVARQAISQRIYARWSNLTGLSLLGLGYATPYLNSYDHGAHSCLAFMPAAQGVTIWPTENRVRTCLVHNRRLPLADNSIDRILCVHGLELNQSSNEYLTEIWRVLKPEGRILIVVPNRRGMWARTEQTPFGHGSPYTYGQLGRQLRQHRFSPEGSSEALFMPPSNHSIFLRPAKALERYGSKIWLPFAGVILMEAKKTVFNPVKPAPIKLLQPNMYPIPNRAVSASRNKSHRLRKE